MSYNAPFKVTVICVYSWRLQRTSCLELLIKKYLECSNGLNSRLAKNEREGLSRARPLFEEKTVLKHVLSRKDLPAAFNSRGSLPHAS